MFPESNVSQTIIDCFLKEAQKHGVKIYTECGLRQFERENDHWKVQTEHETFLTKKILFACGSSPQIWELFKSKGHHIEAPVPSLFTFNISDARIQGLPGLSVPYVTVSIKDSSLEADGPLLITHWGLSGPGILRLSAFGARYLADCDYRFVLCINFSGLPFKETLAALKLLRDAEGKKLCGSTPQYQLPSRWWKSITDHLGITDIKWASLSNLQLEGLAKELSVAEFEVTGKSTFKDEFVTCGGIRLAEVNMKTMQSRILPDVYFAGEMLDIDAITGGFNFQAAWTTSFIASDLQ
jgi:predicted Rossmann fold flavoprotein